VEAEVSPIVIFEGVATELQFVGNPGKKLPWPGTGALAGSLFDEVFDYTRS
jgi:hypothetical protein